ncbi:MAG: hypothetical protein WD928_02380 [Gammaproteobacteria bacterium]
MLTFRLLVLCLFAALSALTACSAPTLRGDTAGAALSANAERDRLRGAMRVQRNPTGPGDPNALWTPRLDGAGFMTLLEGRLEEVGYLAPSAADAPYQVTARIERLDQPLEGITYDVTTKVRYRVHRGGDVREFPIVTTASASLIDHIVATQRLRIASERSVAANIEAFIEALAAY